MALGSSWLSAIEESGVRGVKSFRGEARKMDASAPKARRPIDPRRSRLGIIIQERCGESQRIRPPAEINRVVRPIAAD